MARLAWCLLAIACLPLVLASLGVDVSIPVTQSQFQCMKGQGYSFAIVRCWRSNGQPDPACPTTVRAAIGNSWFAFATRLAAFQNLFTHYQIAAAWAAGFSSVDVYMFPDYSAGNPSSQVQQAVSFLQSHNCRYGKFWIDVEQPPNWGSCTANSAFLQSLVSEAQSLSQQVGIYTSNAMWQPMLCGSKSFSSLPLWYPHYDNNPSFSDFQSFGGWSSPMLKQFKGDTTICGVDVDANYGGGSAATTSATHAATTAGPSGPAATNSGPAATNSGPAATTGSSATSGPAAASSGQHSSSIGNGTSSASHAASSGPQTSSHAASSQSASSHAASSQAASSHSASAASSGRASSGSHSTGNSASSSNSQSASSGARSSSANSASGTSSTTRRATRPQRRL